MRAGDEAAFEVLYDRHHKALLAFCRHMLGNVQDGEDALQQTFIRAHRALLSGPLPDTVKPWLFAIARNRCKTMLAARREATVSVEDHEPSFDGLSDDVARRADLRELVTDLARLPEDQRGALVLFELGGLSQAEIATAIGVPAGKVKALVFQARSELMAERDARMLLRLDPRGARGRARRRAAARPSKRHLRQCEPCDAYRVAVAAQRTGLASIMPVAPALGLKAAILAAAAGGNGAAAGLAGGAGAGAGLHDGGASVFGGAGAGKGRRTVRRRRRGRRRARRAPPRPAPARAARRRGGGGRRRRRRHRRRRRDRPCRDRRQRRDGGRREGRGHGRDRRRRCSGQRRGGRARLGAGRSHRFGDDHGHAGGVP